MSRRSMVGFVVAALIASACGSAASASPDPALAARCKDQVATSRHGVIGRSLTRMEVAVLTTMLHATFPTRDGRVADVSVLTDGAHDFYCVAVPSAAGDPKLTFLGMPDHYPNHVDATHPTAEGPGLIGDLTMRWGAVDGSVSKLDASWTWNIAKSRPAPLPTPFASRAVIANGYFIAVTAAEGEWYPGALAAYDGTGAVIPVSSGPPPSSRPAGSPLSYPWKESAEQDPTGRSATGTQVYLEPGRYRVTLAYHAATSAGRPTSDPSLACTASAKLALVATPNVSVVTLEIKHDPATDPAGTASQVVEFTVQAGALYLVWNAWSCPWALTMDQVPSETPAAS